MNKLLQFVYLNHNAEEHTYKVIPLSVEFGLCKCFPTEPFREAWTLKCLVVERSGQPRHVLRSFAMVKMRNIEELPLKS